jgi:hypothetical protein
MLNYLANYDDDKERKSNTDEFYRDPDRWWITRNKKRIMELENDKRDAENERQGTRTKISSPQPEKVIKQKVEFVSSTAKFKEGQIDKIMTQQERLEMIKGLVATIPTESNELFSFKVKNNIDPVNIV